MPEIGVPDFNTEAAWDRYSKDLEASQCRPEDCRKCGHDCDERMEPPMSLHGQFLFELGVTLSRTARGY